MKTIQFLQWSDTVFPKEDRYTFLTYHYDTVSPMEILTSFRLIIIGDENGQEK